MTFGTREEAGTSLAHLLHDRHVQADIVLGLPRGGVVTAAAVARQLHLPLDILLVRKIGHPQYREFAVGALAEGDVLCLHQEAMAKARVDQAALHDVIEEEKQRLQEYSRRFRSGPIPLLAGRTVLLVDDGLATGATMEAAVLAARQRRAARIIVAVPVASDTAVARLQRSADEVQAVFVDPQFHAVGAYYQHFPQTTDEEVLGLMEG